MARPLISTIIKIKSKEFDVLRRFFFPSNTVLKLLKTDGGAAAFQTLMTVSSGWYVRYSNFRNAFEVSVATLDTNFAANLRKSSHVAVGTDVYKILNGDEIPPQGEECWWRFFCQLSSEKVAV